MKPNFALGLTHDGITLWQRAAKGWLRVGAVAVDSASLESEVRGLAAIARALAPEGVFTKIVIPDDHILFDTVPLAKGSAPLIAASIRKQLEGRTPYPVEDLEFDWVEGDAEVRVAVVARETVIEAEEFARATGFNPVMAVAAPARSDFTHEPFFCMTRAGKAAMPKVTRESYTRDLVRETGIAPLPEPELVANKAMAPRPEEAGKNVAAETPKTTPRPKVAGSAAPVKASTETGQHKADGNAAGPAHGDREHSVQASADMPAHPGPTAEKPKSSPAGAPLSAAAALRKTALLAKLSASRGSGDGATSILGEARRGLTNLFSGSADTSNKSEASGSTENAREISAPEPAATFRSRRASEPDVAKTDVASPTPTVMERLSQSALRGQDAFRSGMTRTRQALAWKNAPKPGEQPPAATSSWPASKSANPSAAQAVASKKAAPGKDAKALSPAARKDPLTTLRERGTSSLTQSEAERMTVFGARNRAQPPSSPLLSRALLVLGGIALLLVAVGVWAAYFYSTQPVTTQLSDVAPRTALIDDADQRISGAAEGISPELAEIEAALGLEDAAEQSPLNGIGRAPDAVMQDEPERLTQRSATPTEAGRIAGLSSVALFAPVEAVPVPQSPTPPSPFGTEPLPPRRSELADNVPAPAEAEEPAAAASALPPGEDALDISVTPGTPPATPPQRPPGLVSEETLLELEAARSANTVPSPDTAAADQNAPDDADLDVPVTQGTPSATPPARPQAASPDAGATPVDGTEGSDSDPVAEDGTLEDDQASLETPAIGGIALTALRPASRPQDFTPIAPPDPFADATRLAVAESLRPDSRPSQFAAIVQRSLRAAQPPPVTATAAAPAVASPAAIAPAPEPVQTARAAVPAAPVIPTQASVAREATQARAINLRQINLIGVTGTQSSRRALVRLSNGRIVTVRVGETLDGGQVTAIGDTELRYNRRGRDVVLRLAS